MNDWGDWLRTVILALVLTGIVIGVTGAYLAQWFLHHFWWLQ